MVIAEKQISFLVFCLQSEEHFACSLLLSFLTAAELCDCQWHRTFSVFMLCVLHPLTNLGKDAIQLRLKRRQRAVFSLISSPLQFTLREWVKDQDYFCHQLQSNNKSISQSVLSMVLSPESCPWKSLLNCCLAVVTSKLHAAFLLGSYSGFTRKRHKQ